MIGIISSGNVGANAAFFLAEKGVDNVILYDVQDGMAKGKALDMMEAAPIRGYRTSIKGTDNVDEVLENEIVIITAGAFREPGMKREDLYCANQEMVKTYAARITRPETKVIIVPEPVDSLTTLFSRVSSLPKGQIMGLGGILDATRLRYLISKALSVSMENVSAQVIGRHSSEMIPIKEYCSISGISLDHFFSSDQIKDLFEQTSSAGSLIVELAGRASAYYGPSAVIAELVEAIVMDTGRVLSVSTVLDGQFGIKDVALSLPCVINRSGISRIIEPGIGNPEIAVLKKSAEMILQTMKIKETTCE